MAKTALFILSALGAGYVLLFGDALPDFTRWASDLPEEMIAFSVLTAGIVWFLTRA